MTFNLPIFKDRFILTSISIALVALQAAIWPIFFKLNDLPEQVIFWHTLPPAGRLAPAELLWFIPATAAAIIILNAIAAYFLYRRYPSIAQTIIGFTALACILAAITIIKTILIYTTLI